MLRTEFTLQETVAKEKVCSGLAQTEAGMGSARVREWDGWVKRYLLICACLCCCSSEKAREEAKTNAIPEQDSAGRPISRIRGNTPQVVVQHLFLM